MVHGVEILCLKMLVLNIYELENVFLRLQEIPSWVKFGTKNVFSRESIALFLTQQGYEIEKIDTDLYCMGKMNVLAYVK